MNKNTSIILFVLLFIIVGYLLIKTNRHKHDIQAAEIGKDSVQTEDDHEEIELAVYMGRLQLFSNKLWFAGKNSNWELAEFYIEEIEETMEEVAEHEILEDGVKVHEQMVVWGLPAIKNIETEAKQKNLQGFELKYNALVSACNSCHQASKHGFIKIKIPDSPVFTNQIY
jgi:hypothetical protein